jgi:V/A-type H+/Na+-transporting ATPase subunit D
MTLKLTKTELRSQQVKLGQLNKYLPTLQLKKAMLQIEVNHAQVEKELLEKKFEVQEERIRKFALLLSDRHAIDLFSAVKVLEVKKEYENIAGIEIPVYRSVVFHNPAYALFDTPLWQEAVIHEIKELLILREKINIVKEKKRALEKELREVSIRVNLFEKIMIPRASENIKKIRIFLSDQQLAAVSQAKVSKQKILLREAAK